MAPEVIFSSPIEKRGSGILTETAVFPLAVCFLVVSHLPLSAVHQHGVQAQNHQR